MSLATNETSEVDIWENDSSVESSETTKPEETEPETEPEAEAVTETAPEPEPGPRLRAAEGTRSAGPEVEVEVEVEVEAEGLEGGGWAVCGAAADAGAKKDKMDGCEAERRIFLGAISIG